MSLLRIALRLPLFVLWTAAMYLLVVISSVAVALRHGRFSLYAAETGPLRTAFFHAWARGLTRLLAVKADVHGKPPDPPFFLVSNHLSYLDVILLASHMRCVFVSKAEVADWPVFGGLARAGDTLFLDRGSKRDLPRVIDRIRRILSGGRGVVVFPEGSSTRGAEVLRFRPSLLETAASAGLPVSYATLSYRTPPGAKPAHLAVCWWGDMPFLGHLLGLLGLPEIRAELRFGDEPIVEQDRKLLARRLQSAVAQQFQPVI